MNIRRATAGREHLPFVHLATILTIAALLRIIIAYGLMPQDGGFGTDLSAFRYWTADLVAHGPWGTYGRGYFLDYLPGYLAILWPLGALSSLVSGGDSGLLIKLPAIISDLLIVVAGLRLARELGATARAQLALALLLAFSPALLLDSTIWGQVDSVGTAVMLFSITELIRGKTVRGGILAALAAVIKPQFGILIPIVALLAFTRARATRDPWLPVVTGLAGAAVIALIALPFGITLIDVLMKVIAAAAGYPYLSVNAWNPWALIDVGGKSIVAATGWASDTAAILPFGIPGVIVGTTLLVAAIAAALNRAKSDERIITVSAVAFVAIAFFVLPTRVHERYLFPAVPLTLILATVRSTWRPIATGISILFTLNAWSVLTTDYFQNKGIPDLGPLTTISHSPYTIAIAALGSLGLLLLAGRALYREAGLRHDVQRATTVALQASTKRQPKPSATDDERPTPNLKITRRDMSLFVAIAVAALLLRGWRIGDPPRFHFDEVYHVRTAAEFLQDWRYGEPHAIYEYTHPHLAKYAIAIGLDTLGAPRVDAETNYGEPVLAVATRNAGESGDGTIWVATSTHIDVITARSHIATSTINQARVIALTVATNGDLWGTTATGEVFHAGAASLQQWSLGLNNVRGIAALSDESFALLTTNELVHVVDGQISERAAIAGGSNVAIVDANGTERVVVTGLEGLTICDPGSFKQPDSTSIDGGAGALVAVDWFDAARLYVASPNEMLALQLNKGGAAIEIARVQISGASAIVANDATHMIHVVAPGPNSGPLSVWSVEPNGNSRFADVAIGGEAPALGAGGAIVDASSDLPDGGAGEMIVVRGDGTTTQVNVGDLPAGWRWPGVLAGAIAAALLVLLARLLTNRRDVAVIVGLLALLDGAGFVQSRIGMNDVYLLVFLLGAMATFIATIQGRLGEGARAAGGLALTGVLLGAALASKWVALYGIAGLGLIWLARTPVGRVAALVGITALMALLLPPALAVGADATRLPNVPFAIVAALIASATAASTWRAGGLTASDIAPHRFAALLPRGTTLMIAALFVIPLGVYVLSYMPWVALGNRITENWPPGNQGQTLIDLTASMYRYHDTLRVAHAASSPWWAWPFDLKPVWFYQDTYTGSGSSWTAAIYDGGNVVSRWLSVAGAIWVGREAWQRKSWGLASVLVLFLAMWLPWSRIDRAAFEYHYYPAGQIALIGLALLLADLRAGNERAATLVRRASAALLVAAPILWIAAGLVCTVAGVESVYPESQVCLSFGFATPGPIVGAIALVPATMGAWTILGLREPRTLFRSALAAIGIVALVWYPNWSALPLPTGLHNWYQGLLPTWTWSFQFGVTLEQPAETPLVGGGTAIAALLLGLAAVGSIGLLKLWRERKLNKDRA